MKWTFLAGALMVGALALVGAARAQTYPERPVTLVLGFATGGPADIAARMVADGLSKRLGQPVIVKNEPGATGTIAAGSVARAPADGYTLLVASQSTFAIAPHTFATVPFDPTASFAPITATITSPWVLLVNSSLPAKNLKEFVEYASKRPGELNYGSVGRGSSHNFVTELFKQAANIDVKHVPFKGSSDAYLALARGDIHMLFDTLPSPLALVADGRLRAIGITGAQRLSVLPQVPTMAEQGIPVDAASWFGLVAPAKTPPAIIARLNREAVAALSEVAFQESLRKMGLGIATSSQSDFGNFLANEQRRWKGIVEKIDFKKE